MMRVLIVDEHELTDKNISPLLTKLDHEYLCVKTKEDALNFCKSDHFDIVFINVDQFHSELSEIVNQIHADCYNLSDWIPIIVTSAKKDDETILNAIYAGGDDFIQKPTTIDILDAKLIAISRIISMRQNLVDFGDQLKLLNDQLFTSTEMLNAMILKDPLTLIPNRRAFQDYFYRIIRSCTRKSEAFSIIMADIDFFKDYNDQYGHQEGDHCLVKVAQTLSKHLLRPGDLVSRIGGEEFAIILPETKVEDACLVAERLRQSILALGLDFIGSPLGRITLSFGVAQAYPSRDFKPDGLMAIADQALYLAKKHQGNTVFYCPESVDNPLTVTCHPRKYSA